MTVLATGRHGTAPTGRAGDWFAVRWTCDRAISPVCHGTTFTHGRAGTNARGSRRRTAAVEWDACAPGVVSTAAIAGPACSHRSRSYRSMATISLTWYTPRRSWTRRPERTAHR